MKLASITLPKPNRKLGQDKFSAMLRGHSYIVSYLIDTNQGYTCIDASGYWTSPQGTRYAEQVFKYEFTMVPDEYAEGFLQGLAATVKEITGEQAVFIVHVDGTAEFI